MICNKCGNKMQFCLFSTPSYFCTCDLPEWSKWLALAIAPLFLIALFWLMSGVR